MAQTLLGMEFGNSYVSIVKQGEGLVLKQANLVAVKKEHNDYSNYCVGEKAKNLLGKTDDRIVVFSLVYGGEIISLPHAIYELKQYKEYSTKTVEITIKQAKKVATVKVTRPTSTSTTPNTTTYTVVSGDCL